MRQRQLITVRTDTLSLACARDLSLYLNSCLGETISLYLNSGSPLSLPRELLPPSPNPVSLLPLSLSGEPPRLSLYCEPHPSLSLSSLFLSLSVSREQQSASSLSNPSATLIPHPRFCGLWNLSHWKPPPFSATLNKN
ncbi:hypothetical protein AMTRI_Chr02g260980 [Amborella trichopoda]